MTTSVHRSPKQPRLRAVLALLVCAALPALGGCSGATATTSPSASSSPTTSLVVAPTAPPAEVPAAPSDLAAATDFVLAWFQALNYGLATGDADPLRSTTSLACFTCAGWVTQIQQQHDAGERRDGGLLALGGAAAVGMIGDDFVLRVSIQQQPGTIADGSGPARPVPAAGSTEVVDLQVGVSTASLDGTPRWRMKSITPPR